METGSALAGIHWLAVLLAAISAFAVGALWYGPILGRTWMSLTGLTEEVVREGNMVRIFGLAFLLELLAAAVLALVVGPDAGPVAGAVVGLLVGFGFVGTAVGVVYLFERRPLALWAVDAGYQVVIFTLMGAILGAW